VRHDGEFYHVDAMVGAPVLGRIDAPILIGAFNKLMAEAAGDKQTSRREALEDLFWAVLASKEFVFNH